MFFYFIQDIGTFQDILTYILKKKVEECKRYFFERLIEEYTLNQWQFRYLEWVIEKMNDKSAMVNPTSFILNSNPADDYLVHLTECFKLFNF